MNSSCVRGNVRLFTARRSRHNRSTLCVTSSLFLLFNFSCHRRKDNINIVCVFWHFLWRMYCTQWREVESCLYLELTAHKFDLRGAGTFTHYVICMCIITWYLICIFNFLNYHHYQYIATPLETTNHIHLTYPWFNAMSVVGESRVKPNGPGL